MLLQPEWSPAHLSKYWVYMRAVYMPFAFLYGKVRTFQRDSPAPLRMLSWLTAKLSLPPSVVP